MLVSGRILYIYVLCINICTGTCICSSETCALLFREKLGKPTGMSLTFTNYMARISSFF